MNQINPLFRFFMQIRRRIASKLILMVGLTLLIIITGWSHYTIEYQQERLTENILDNASRLTNTIKLGAHYAMMINSRDDINQIINNIAKQPELENIRIYNKQGQIKFSNDDSEVERTTNIKDEACYICHRSEPPRAEVDLAGRTRILDSGKGYRLLGIISPICNEPGCATNDCHVHPAGKKILGALDVVVSLEKTDREIALAEGWVNGLAILVFLVTSAIIFLFLLRFVNYPARKLIDGTRRIALGQYDEKINIPQDDEMGQIGSAINQMGEEIAKHQEEINRQRDQYQNLFESVPCLITVQDRGYNLLNYNREFAEKFAPEPGDFCYHAYKGRNEKCEFCPVEHTFADGLSHAAEETGVDKAGAVKHWIVRTTPITDETGKIVAAMEISHDITERKLLEEELDKSEKKYHAIFNNIPNPVFVLDAETLEILDCNKSVAAVYGFTAADLVRRSFLELFLPESRETVANGIRSSKVINQVRHLTKSGRVLFVNIRISPSEYTGRKVFLVTTSDITKRLEAEQQLIQASKMATLGEMATGVAHELNQPLSVIKTVSSFCIEKIRKEEPIAPNILNTMLTKVDSNVDRATRIINHMRQFARKSDMEMEKIHVKDVIENAFEIFSQQLKVKGIDLFFETDTSGGEIPKISADPGRLEQVFINLLINARDAIEDKWEAEGRTDAENRITVLMKKEADTVVVTVCDTGKGFPAGLADRIFEPFFTTKEVGKGTGLGLSISYGIVKECGGTIRAASCREISGAEEEGACFILTFPVPDSNAPARRKEGP